MLKTFYDPEKIPIRFRIGFILVTGILFCLIGISAIVLSIVELFHGRPKEYHYNDSQGGLQIENPLWPSSGEVPRKKIRFRNDVFFPFQEKDSGSD